MTSTERILIDCWQEGHICALVRQNKIIDLFADFEEKGGKHRSIKYHSVYCASVERELKGANGFILNLGNSCKGFIKKKSTLNLGDTIFVQCVNFPDKNKLPLFSSDILIKDKYFIFTPNDERISLSKKIKGDARILSLTQNDLKPIITKGLLGAIVRSSVTNLSDAKIIEELKAKLVKYQALSNFVRGKPRLIFEGHSAKDRALAEWSHVVEENIIENLGCFETHGLWDHIVKLNDKVVELQGGGSMIIEPTSALISIDINSAKNNDKNGTLEVNRQAMLELPRQLRLRGLGGIINIDFAPLGKSDRQFMQNMLSQQLAQDPVRTNILGWTPAGNLELNRKRDRSRVKSWSI